MRVMRAHDQDKHSPLVSFCEVVSHDPFFLIGKPRAPFRLADLARHALRLGVRGADAVDVPAAGPARPGHRPGEACRASPTAPWRATTMRCRPATST